MAWMASRRGMGDVLTERFRQLLAEFHAATDPARAREIEWELDAEMRKLPAKEQAELRRFLTGGMIGN
jgi:hypothetical protein